MIWILISEYNDYNQHGQYFEAVFFKKPTISQLVACGMSEHAACNLLIGGGGRSGSADRWFDLTEYNEVKK